jgi:hypothetical protein
VGFEVANHLQIAGGGVRFEIREIQASAKDNGVDQEKPQYGGQQRGRLPPGAAAYAFVPVFHTGFGV